MIQDLNKKKFPERTYHSSSSIKARDYKDKERALFEFIKKLSQVDYGAVFHFIYKIKDKEFRIQKLVKLLYYYHFENDSKKKQRRTVVPFTIAESKLIASLVGVSYFIKIIIQYKESNISGKIMLLSDVFYRVKNHKIPLNGWGRRFYRVKPRLLHHIKTKIMSHKKMLSARKEGRPYPWDEILRVKRRKSGRAELFKSMIERGKRIQI